MRLKIILNGQKTVNLTRGINVACGCSLVAILVPKTLNNVKK